jgi:hypothetical protein
MAAQTLYLSRRLDQRFEHRRGRETLFTEGIGRLDGVVHLQRPALAITRDRCASARDAMKMANGLPAVSVFMCHRCLAIPPCPVCIQRLFPLPTPADALTVWLGDARRDVCHVGIGFLRGSREEESCKEGLHRGRWRRDDAA